MSSLKISMYFALVPPFCPHHFPIKCHNIKQPSFLMKSSTHIHPQKTNMALENGPIWRCISCLKKNTGIFHLNNSQHIDHWMTIDDHWSKKIEGRIWPWTRPWFPWAPVPWSWTPCPPWLRAAGQKWSLGMKMLVETVGVEMVEGI